MTEFMSGNPVEGAELARSTATQLAQITGRSVRETENLIPYFLSCGYWNCEPTTTTTTTTQPDLPMVQPDDHFHQIYFAVGANVPGVDNAIDNAPLVRDDNIHLGPVNIPRNPFNWGRRK